MYDQPIDAEAFLAVTYKLLIKKVERLIEIDTHMRRGKTPLPLLKEKLESTSNIIEALRQLITLIDYDKPAGEMLSNLYNSISIKLTLGTLDHDTDAYEDIIITVKILQAKLKEA